MLLKIRGIYIELHRKSEALGQDGQHQLYSCHLGSVIQSCPFRQRTRDQRGERWQGTRHICMPKEVGPECPPVSWRCVCCPPFQMPPGKPVPYVSKTDRYDSTTLGPRVKCVCPAVADASESGITGPGFTSEENGAIKRQLFKWCESALQLLAMPSKGREWCGECLSLFLFKQSSG